jgi:ABC-type branched-subunit amino acid transport system permease subunit
MGPGGMHSLRPCGLLGLGAYGAAIVLKATGLSMMWALLVGPLAGLVGALLFGWYYGTALGCLPRPCSHFAFSQIVWSIILSRTPVTGGSNGLTGLWPAEWLSARYPGLTPNAAYYLLTLACVAGAVLVLRRVLDAPFGLAVRAGRDFAPAGRIDRHRRAPHPVDGVLRGGNRSRTGRRALRLFQGQHRPRHGPCGAIDRRARHWCCSEASSR